MARTAPNHNFAPILDAARTWIDRCMIGDESIFSDSKLWTRDVANQLRTACVDNPDASDKEFWEKLEGQLQKQPKPVVQLAAEMVWAMYLFPWGGHNADFRTTTKRNNIRKLWSWAGVVLSGNHKMLTDEVLMGIGRAGQRYKQLWHELKYLILLTCDLKSRPTAGRRDVLENYDEHVRWVNQILPGEDKQFRHMLRYFAFPDLVERIASSKERRKILKGFEVATSKEINGWDDARIDKEVHKIREQYENDNPGEVLGGVLI